MEMWASQKIQPLTLSHVDLCPTPTPVRIRHPIFVSIMQHYLHCGIRSFTQFHLVYSGITSLKLRVSCFQVLVKQVSKPISRLMGLEEVTDNYLLLTVVLLQRFLNSQNNASFDNCPYYFPKYTYLTKMDEKIKSEVKLLIICFLGQNFPRSRP